MNAQKSWEKEWKAEMLGVIGTVLGLVDVLLPFMLMCITLDDSQNTSLRGYDLIVMLPLGVIGLICSVISSVQKVNGYGKTGIYVNCAKIMYVLGGWIPIFMNKLPLTANTLVEYFQLIVLLVVPAVAPIIASHILEIKSIYKMIIGVISVVSGSWVILSSSWHYIFGTVFVIVLAALTMVNYIVLTVGIYQADYLSYDNNDIRRTGKNLWIMNVYIYGAIAVIGLLMLTGTSLFQESVLLWIMVGSAAVGVVINVAVRNGALIIALNSVVNLVVIFYGLSMQLTALGIILCVLGIAACLSNIVEIYGISCQHFGRISTQANN